MRTVPIGYLWVSASRLILCIVAERPLHVVAATDEATGLTYLITTYVADPNLWEVDFKTRRKP